MSDGQLAQCHLLVLVLDRHVCGAHQGAGDAAVGVILPDQQSEPAVACGIVDLEGEQLLRGDCSPGWRQLSR